VLEKAGIPRVLPSGEGDAGLLVAAAANEQLAASFLQAIAAHRHFARETDPPLV
jgi:catalase